MNPIDNYIYKFSELTELNDEIEQARSNRNLKIFLVIAGAIDIAAIIVGFAMG